VILQSPYAALQLTSIHDCTACTIVACARSPTPPAAAAVAVCIDTSRLCLFWAQNGYCGPQWVYQGTQVLALCPQSCSMCKSSLAVKSSATTVSSSAASSSSTIPATTTMPTPVTAGGSNGPATQNRNANTAGSSSSTSTDTSRTGAGTSRTSTAATSTLPADMAAVLQRHNSYRERHGVPALTWDAALAQRAQQWADHCQWAHSGPGENLAMGFLTGPEAVDAWYNEVRACTSACV
jgi:uncharacterized protein YkwD